MILNQRVYCEIITKASKLDTFSIGLLTC